MASYSMNSNIIEQIYDEQSQLLFDVHRNPNNIRSKLSRVVELAKKDCIEGNSSVYTTGVYCNAANASSNLYHKWGEIRDLDDAFVFCDKALTAKPDNQTALSILFSINLAKQDYQVALEALSKINLSKVQGSHDAFVSSLLHSYEIHFQQQKMNDLTDNHRALLTQVTSTIIDKFPSYAAVYALAMDYFITIGDNAIKAYEYAKLYEAKCSPSELDANFYHMLGWICLYPSISLYAESIVYTQKAIETEKDKSLLPSHYEQYALALTKSKRFEEAIAAYERVTRGTPTDTVFFNFANCLYEYKKYTDALEWANKAVLIYEDEMDLELLARIHKVLHNNDQAIMFYKKTLAHLMKHQHILTSEWNGRHLLSYQTDKTIDWTTEQVLEGLLSVLCIEKDYSSAMFYLQLAQETVPGSPVWDVYQQLIPEIITSQDDMDRIRKEFNKLKEDAESMIQKTREWAKKLLLLQNKTQNNNLDLFSDWRQFESEIDRIIDAMKTSDQRHSEIYCKIKERIKNDYNSLDDSSCEFLATAETLYELHKNQTIDFAAIVIEYCKVIERRLRKLVGRLLPTHIKMLGQIIQFIDERNILPYVREIKTLQRINELRRNSAHTGVLGIREVEEIRNIFFDRELLRKLL